MEKDNQGTNKTYYRIQELLQQLGEMTGDTTAFIKQMEDTIRRNLGAEIEIVPYDMVFNLEIFRVEDAYEHFERAMDAQALLGWMKLGKMNIKPFQDSANKVSRIQCKQLLWRMVPKEELFRKTKVLNADSGKWKVK